MSRKYTFLLFVTLVMLLCSQCRTVGLKPRIDLFNGRDLAGWRQTGHAKWVVENGILIGSQDAQGRPGDLLTIQEYDDFHLMVVFRIVFPGNSGIWFRKPEGELGYQMDILEGHPESMTGGIWSGAFLSSNKDESTFNRDGWNEVAIHAEGDRIQVTLNGTKVADISDGTYSRGAIGFQVHAGDEFRNMKIMVKQARIMPLQH
jgi:hypothetical protein